MGVGKGVFEASISVLGVSEAVSNFTSGLFDQLSSQITSNRAIKTYAKETAEKTSESLFGSGKHRVKNFIGTKIGTTINKIGRSKDER